MFTGSEDWNLVALVEAICQPATVIFSERSPQTTTLKIPTALSHRAFSPSFFFIFFHSVYHLMTLYIFTPLFLTLVGFFS